MVQNTQSERAGYETPAIIYEEAIEVCAYNPPDLSKLLEP